MSLTHEKLNREEKRTPTCVCATYVYKAYNGSKCKHTHTHTTINTLYMIHLYSMQHNIKICEFFWPSSIV